MIPRVHAIHARTGADGGVVVSALLKKPFLAPRIQPGRVSPALSGAGQTRLHRYPSPLSGRSRQSPGRPPRFSARFADWARTSRANRRRPACGRREAARSLAEVVGMAQESASRSKGTRGRIQCAGDTFFPSWPWPRSRDAARRRLNRGRWAPSGAPWPAACLSTIRLPGQQWALRATSPGASVFRHAADCATTRDDTITETRPGPRGRMPAAASCRLKAGPGPGTGEGSGCSRRS